MEQASPLAPYPLAANGAIRHWLACGPVITPLRDLHDVVPPQGSAFGPGRRWAMSYWAFHPQVIALKQRVYAHLPPFAWHPGARPAVNQTGIGGQPWRYATAEEDDAIDFSRFNFAPSLLQGWLFAVLDTAHAQTVRAELVTIGPVRLWLNGRQLVESTDRFSYVAPLNVPVTLALAAGPNELYVQGDMLGWREARLALGLRLLDPDRSTVLIPLGDLPVEQWQHAEAGLNALRVPQFAVPVLPGAVTLDPAAPGPVEVEAGISIPLPDSTGEVLAEHRVRLALKPGESGPLPLTPEIAAASAALPGEHTLALALRPVDGMPLEIHRSLWASRQTFSHAPYGDYESRRHEALEHLAAMPHDVQAAMAAVALGRAAAIPGEAVAPACHFVEQRYDCADFYAIGLLALLAWYGDHPALRAAERERIERALSGFKYWIDEPGIDGMCYITENHQILFHVTGYLAGQRWPDHIFSNSGFTGRDLMRRARGRIEDWVTRRLQGGFSEWDSNFYLTMDIFAMLALVEFARSARVRALAEALLNKMFFMIACQSFRGVHGSTHGRCYVEGLKSARAEMTSSLQRIAWGMGIFNGETRAAGLLALARRYRVPEVIQRIGADLPDELVTRVRAYGHFRPQFDIHRGIWNIRTLTHRTPDAMLAAAVDHRPGAMGIQEHLWQATLGPEAVIFTTYPGNSQEHGSARPNFWAGSARLPRVGMAGRTAICLYGLEPGVGLGFSHAYFPTAAFDEWRIEGPWAFTRAGNGYAALWGDGDLRLSAGGRHAGQELRSAGAGQTWLCCIGRTAGDGSFADFCARVRQHAPQPEGSGVRWTDPDGHALAFAWESPLLLDGQPQDWDHFPHYENSYTSTLPGASQMVIRHGGETLVIDLTGGRSSPGKTGHPG